MVFAGLHLHGHAAVVMRFHFTPGIGGGFRFPVMGLHAVPGFFRRRFGGGRFGGGRGSVLRGHDTQYFQPREVRVAARGQGKAEAQAQGGCECQIYVSSYKTHKPS